MEAEADPPICQKCGKPVTGYSVGKSRRRGVVYTVEVRCHGEVDQYEYYPVSPNDAPFEPRKAFPTDRPPAVGAAPTGPATHPMDIQAELLAMPEWVTLQRVQHFATSIRLFKQNAARLKEFLEVLMHDPRAAHLSSVSHRADLDQVMEEVLLLLHNFVAAAMSLVDHSRRFSDKVYGGGEFPDFAEQVKARFVENPQVQFVHCLRQFAQHYRLPHISYVVRGERGAKLKTSLVLTKDDLLEFDGWNAGAKKFLATAPAQLDVHEVVTTYETTISGFYDWVAQRQREIHATELAAVEAKQAQGRAAMAAELPRLIETSLSIYERGVGRLHDVFAFGFGPQDWLALRPFESDVQKWVEKALELVASRFGPLPEDLIRRLRHAARPARRVSSLNLEED